VIPIQRSEYFLETKITWPELLQSHDREPAWLALFFPSLLKWKTTGSKKSKKGQKGQKAFCPFCPFLPFLLPCLQTEIIQLVVRERTLQSPDLVASSAEIV
jgi:hypothetical protein